jgi:hypothetical protein
MATEGLLPGHAAGTVLQSEEAVMSDEDGKATLQPMLSARDQNDDLAGASILTLLQRSADMAEGNSQRRGHRERPIRSADRE